MLFARIYVYKDYQDCCKKKKKTKKMLKAKKTKETDKKYCKVQKGMDFIDGMTDSWNNAANKYQKHIRW